jgi:geranylgeranyl diphosphate synthase type II
VKESFEQWFVGNRAIVNEALENTIEGARRDGPVWEAMKYSLLAGGKRLRPILFIAAFEAAGGKNVRDYIDLAVAVELIHTYSLIHDDLPALDNDTLRRGVETCHVKFGEAFAILAGDALLTLAFASVASVIRAGRADIVVRIIAETASAAGINGMIGGQETDLLLEGSNAEGVDEDTLSKMHSEKTGALIQLPLRMGGLVAGADSETVDKLGEFGKLIGLAFQVRDDILDVTGNTKKLGKRAGEDMARMKATYPALLGVEGSERKTGELMELALEKLAESKLPGGRTRLEQLARFIVEREL